MPRAALKPMQRSLSLDDFGYWSPRIVYGLAMRGVVTVSVPTARVPPCPGAGTSATSASAHIRAPVCVGVAPVPQMS